MIRNPNPFDITITKTERTNNQKIVEWMNQIIKEENLHFGLAEQETSGSDRKQPDIILFKAPHSTLVTLVLELKPPFFDPLDYEEVKKPAWDKANIRKTPYFATSNFKSLYLFNTERANKFESEERQVIDKYTLSNLEDLNFIEEPIYKNSILKNLTIFLKDLDRYVHDQKPEKLLAIDEWLMYRLQEKVKTLSSYYRRLIEEESLNNIEFRKSLRTWFNEQGWGFTAQTQDFAKAARQTAYLLVNKILFYDVLRTSFPQNFPQMHIPDDFHKGGMVQRYLQNFFDEVLKIDYETIYSTDFIDETAFPDDENVIYHIRELVKSLNRFNFARIEFEVLGRIFESLIPQEERHVLGQYFTHSDIVDFILSFAIRNENDKIFDPGCGAGTFLRRAYHIKNLLNPNLTHDEIIPTLWGNDIAKFPAHLATINLAIADLKSKDNYPRIVQKDFFEWNPGLVDLPESTKKVFLKSLGKDEKEVVVPKYFDAIVGNPPYTRQEEMDDLMGSQGQKYKEELIEKAVRDENGRLYANISKRAGLHAYFFVHGTKFLKNGGRFGFIVSNSWLDVDYGKGLQEHFLKYYKIKAIIESKIERWFEDADVNTCIVLLEKCEGESKDNIKAREENIVRFAYLKKRLSDFIPKASRIFEETVDRKEAVERLLQYIFSKTSFFENDDLRVCCKTQKELWEEGFDEEMQNYVGSKWGKYIRAPQIFFTILEKAKDKLIPLKKIATVRRGITTGANEFFYLTADEIKRKKIEKEFWTHKDESGNWVPNYIIRSPRECKSIIVNPLDLQYRVLLVHRTRDELKGTHLLSYIKEGERRGFHKRPTCASRKNWWDLGERKQAFINANYLIHDVGRAYIGKYWVSDDFQEIHTEKSIEVVLNSSIFWLFQNIEGRTSFGGGLLKIQTYEFKNLLVVLHNDKATELFGKLSSRQINSVFEEIGAITKKEVSLTKIKSDRRALDSIIMGDILGLTEEEQIEVYKAVIDLVRSRLERAKSIKKKNRTKEGIDISLLVKTIIDKIGENRLGEFYKKHILDRKDLKKIILPELTEPPTISQTLMDFRLISGRKSIDCVTEQEAQYCKIFLEIDWREVKVPKDSKYLISVLPQLEKINKEIKEAIYYYTEGVLDKRIQNQVEHMVWHEVSSFTSTV